MLPPAPVPRIVIDTNVLLDLWIFEERRTRSLLSALAHRRVLALRSAETDDELRDVLGRTQFSLPADRQALLLQSWQSIAQPVSRVFAAPWHCTDPCDQKFLDLAHTAQATVLLTKDKALLKVNRRARRDGLLIVPPSTWAASEASVQDDLA